MGRKKLEMKRIDDKSSRQVTFTKRRGGLIKKARELSILCDVDVSLVVLSCRGKLYEFCSSDSAAQIIQRYQTHHEAEEMVNTGGSEAESKYANFLPSSELLQIVQRQVEEPFVDQLSVSDLVLLEKQIDAALMEIRFRKTQLMMDSIADLHRKRPETQKEEKENLLREENGRLAKELGELKTDGRINSGKELMGDLNLETNHYSDWHSRQPMLQLL